MKKTDEKVSERRKGKRRKEIRIKKIMVNTQGILVIKCFRKRRSICSSGSCVAKLSPIGLGENAVKNPGLFSLAAIILMGLYVSETLGSVEGF